MFRFIIPLLCLFNFLVASDYKIVAYYTNWSLYRSPSFKPSDINFDLVTHINYAFANVDSKGNILLTDPWADTDYRSDWNRERPFWGNFAQFADLKKKFPHLKTLISIGGWTLSDNFSKLAACPEARTAFAQNAVRFCQKYQFDGIDIDWEYPGFASHRGRPVDKENFTLLLAELHAAAKAAHPPLLLTIAAPAGPWHCNNMQLDQIHPYLDWINLMTYDLHGPWGDSDNRVTNHQAALFASPKDSLPLSLYDAVKIYFEKGVPAEKLVVGMPFYGRSYANTTGLFTPYSGAGSGTTQEAGVRFYYDIKQNLLPHYTLHWDKTAEAPYLVSAEKREFITFDNPKSLKLKCQWLKKLNLGGAMIWELGQDCRPSWELLKSISDELKKSPF